MRILPIAFLMVSTALSISAVAGETDLPLLDPLFGDNMVLQRDQPDPVWGWTTPGQTVTVEIAEKTLAATAGGDGRWTVKLPALPGGGPFTMTVSTAVNQQVKVRNILLGDVWVCSGQSNMSMSVADASDGNREIATADHPEIRLLTVHDTIAISPQKLAAGSWESCRPSTVAGFSAVGYFFGRALHDNLKVPVGLIHTSRSSTPAVTWISEPAIKANLPQFDGPLAALDHARSLPGTWDYLSFLKKPNHPSMMFNGMVHPLIPFGIKGVIWYQGESDAGDIRDADARHDLTRARAYRKLLPVLIADWRQRWGEGDFPFLIVQLAGFRGPPAEPEDDALAELRESQWIVSKTVPNSGIATAMDIGDADRIHPPNKQEVGRRLALVAEARVYHENVDYSGPVYRSMAVEGNAIRVRFDHAEGGLVARGGDVVTGFAVKGSDGSNGTAGSWHWAEGKTAGDTVVVSSASVAHPVAVQYGWASYLPCNLYTKAGLPAFPFRTDRVTENARPQ